MRSLDVALKALQCDADKAKNAQERFKVAANSVKVSYNIASRWGHTGVRVGHVKHLTDFSLQVPEEKEVDFLGRVVNKVQLMKETSRLLGAVRLQLYGDSDTAPNLDPAVMMRLVVEKVHKLKICTARACWLEIQDDMKELKSLREDVPRLKDRHISAQSEYLKEVSTLRDALRHREDHCADMSHKDVVMYYEPFAHLDSNLQDLTLEVTREKVKMLFDTNPELTGKANGKQLQLMSALVESRQLSEAKEALKRKSQEVEELKFRVREHEMKERKQERESGNPFGVSPDAMLAMDREVQTLRMDLHRKEEERQNEITLKENALAQVKELNAKVKELEEMHFALDLEAERERKEIEVLVEERDDAQKKLCRSESMLKESQVELQKLKQAVARHKKVDKAQRALFSSNDTHPGAQHDQEVAAAAYCNEFAALPHEEHGDNPFGMIIDKVTKQINENSLDPATMKDLLRVAQQLEQDSTKMTESNHMLKLQRQELYDENVNLRESMQKMMLEFTSMQVEQELAQTVRFANEESDIDDLIDGMTQVDGSTTSNDKVSVQLLEQEISEVDVKIHDTEDELKFYATSKSFDPDHAKSVLELEDKLSNLTRKRWGLACQLLRRQFSDSMHESGAINTEDLSTSCPTCEAYKKTIESQQKALKICQDQIAKLTDSVQKSCDENGRLQTMIEMLQKGLIHVAHELQTSEALKDKKSIKQVLRLINNTQMAAMKVRMDTVFDRLYMDAKMRKTRRQNSAENVGKRKEDLMMLVRDMWNTTTYHGHEGKPDSTRAASKDPPVDVDIPIEDVDLGSWVTTGNESSRFDCRFKEGAKVVKTVNHAFDHPVRPASQPSQPTRGARPSSGSSYLPTNATRASEEPPLFSINAALPPVSPPPSAPGRNNGPEEARELLSPTPVLHAAPPVRSQTYMDESATSSTPSLDSAPMFGRIVTDPVPGPSRKIDPTPGPAKKITPATQGRRHTGNSGLKHQTRQHKADASALVGVSGKAFGG